MFERQAWWGQRAAHEAVEWDAERVLTSSGTNTLYYLHGNHQFIMVDLEPGNYVMFCFLTDPESHAPHFALGMITEFAVK